MSRVNHNANYIYDVDGETIWEKLRVIRELLDDRERTLKISKLKSKNIPESDTTEHEIWLINKKFNDSLLEDCFNEIKFLKEFESFLTEEAEKTRIAGKTDDEMYEINYFHEMEVRLVRKAQAQIATYGQLNEELMLRLMKNKGALRICVQQGLLTKDIVNFVDTPLLPSYDVHTINFIEVKTND